MEAYIFIIIIMACVVIGVIATVKYKTEILVNFLLRIVAGIVGIYLLNFILKYKGIDIGVGINSITILLVGLFGIPGFILTYSISLYFIIRG